MGQPDKSKSKTNPGLLTDMNALKSMFANLLDDKLDPIYKRLENIERSLETINTDISDVKKSVEFANETSDSALNLAKALENRVQVLESALVDSHNRVDHLQEQNLHMETYSRRDTLRFDGIPETNGENCKIVITEVIAKLSLVKVPVILWAQRMGTHVPSNTGRAPRTVMVTFGNIPDRELVWNNRCGLKGTSIWLNEDYPIEIDNRRKKLWPFLRAARVGNATDPNKRVVAYLVYDKLVINNKSYSLRTLDTLPEFVKANMYERRLDNLVLFYTKRSVFSNFYPATFVVAGKSYNCAEQFVSCGKALLFDQPELAEDILQTTDPNIQKQKSRSAALTSFRADVWKKHAPELLKVALHAKFTQNATLKDELLKTGTCDLAEASPTDNLFGIGLSVNNPKSRFKEQWRGDNLQGNTLMDVRAELN